MKLSTTDQIKAHRYCFRHFAASCSPDGRSSGGDGRFFGAAHLPAAHLSFDQ